LYGDCRRKGFIDDDFWLGDDPYMVYTKEHSCETLQGFVRTINSYKSPVRRAIEKAKRLPRILDKIRVMTQ
jgi:hypothetical protein